MLILVGSILDTIDAFYQASWGNAFYAFPPVDDAPRALVHILSQTSVRGPGASITAMGEVVQFLYSIP